MDKLSLPQYNLCLTRGFYHLSLHRVTGLIYSASSFFWDGGNRLPAAAGSTRFVALLLMVFTYLQFTAVVQVGVLPRY
jgi:hypothetical protein